MGLIESEPPLDAEQILAEQPGAALPREIGLEQHKYWVPVTLPTPCPSPGKSSHTHPKKGQVRQMFEQWGGSSGALVSVFNQIEFCQKN